jgi:hypothetical protein
MIAVLVVIDEYLTVFWSGVTFIAFSGVMLGPSFIKICVIIKKPLWEHALTCVLQAHIHNPPPPPQNPNADWG